LTKKEGKKRKKKDQDGESLTLTPLASREIGGNGKDTLRENSEKTGLAYKREETTREKPDVTGAKRGESKRRECGKGGKVSSSGETFK